MCAQPMMFPTPNTCNAPAPGAFRTCTKFEKEFMLPEFSGVVVSARANHYTMKVPSSFWSSILNGCCSYHGTSPFNAI